MLEVLQSGRALSFLADQDAGQRGLFVDFFGRPASTHKAIALLAIEHQAPVVVGVARRVGPGFRYEIRCEDVIEPGELDRHRRRRPAPHPAVHLGPRAPDPPGPDPVPLAPSPLEASAGGSQGSSGAVAVAVASRVVELRQCAEDRASRLDSTADCRLLLPLPLRHSPTTPQTSAPPARS